MIHSHLGLASREWVNVLVLAVGWIDTTALRMKASLFCPSFHQLPSCKHIVLAWPTEQRTLRLSMASYRKFWRKDDALSNKQIMQINVWGGGLPWHHCDIQKYAHPQDVPEASWAQKLSLNSRSKLSPFSNAIYYPFTQEELYLWWFYFIS